MYFKKIQTTLLKLFYQTDPQFFEQARIVAQGDSQAQFVIDCRHYILWTAS